MDAAKLLGTKQVPVIPLESLTPSQVRAYVIADNRLAEEAGWDKPLLKIELENLIIDGKIDIALTGFEVPEIDLILGTEVAEEDPADVLPAEQIDLVTRLGDIWQLGEHRILCGDARDEESYRILMEGRQASVIFADPPYNVVIDGHASGNGSTRHREFAMASGEMTASEFTSFLTRSLSRLAQWSTNGSIH